jgi:hypothetical protein
VDFEVELNTGTETRLIQSTSVADRGIARVPIVDGQGRTVWEITSAGFNVIDQVSFGVTVAYLRPAGCSRARDSLRQRRLRAGELHQLLLRQGPLPRFRRLRSVLPAFEISLGEACEVEVRDVVLGGLDDPLRDDLFALNALAGTLLDLHPADYRLQVNARLPREKLRLNVVRALGAPGDVFIQETEAVAGSVLNVTLKGKGADPDIIDLVDPTRDATVPLDFFLRPGPKKEIVKGLVLPLTGVYSLRFTGAAADAGGNAPGAPRLGLSIRIKAPGRRVLEECLE